jgi:glycosyltransferase involved in cell wall biosynthesis
VLASAVGELPEALGGGAGVLVPAGDARALARELERLCADPVGRDRAASLGAQRVREAYSAQAMAGTYAGSVYDVAVGSRTALAHSR